MLCKEPAAAPTPAPGAPTCQPDPPGQWAKVLLSLCLGLALLAALLYLLAPLAPPPADFAKVRRLIAVDMVMNNADALRPEPLERFLYICGVLLLPFCLGASHLVVHRSLSGARGRDILQRLEPAAVWLTTATASGLLIAAGFSELGKRLEPFIPGGWYSLAIASVLALTASTAAAGRLGGRGRWLPTALSAGVLGALFLGTVALSVFREEHILNIPLFWATFNAVFYSVVQVYLGRELTVDFISQYGMFPHLLEPIFRFTGLSVFTFTLLMGLLNCLVFACVHRFLLRETRSALIALLGTTSVFFFCYASARAVLQPDHCFQYHPLRMLFPALLLLLAQAFAHGPRWWMPAALGGLGAAACLWTTDVGVIVLAAGLLLLGYDALARRHAREIPWQLVQAIAAAVGVISLFSLFLRLRYGAFPDFTRLLLYPQAFYLHGHGMIPMPRFGFWVPVLVVYAVGLLRSLIPLAVGESRPRERIFFLLSVLGLGVFTYYQGRSVLGNLAAAAYPAILLLALFTDDLRGAASCRGLTARRALIALFLTLLFFSVPALAGIAPTWVKGVAAKIEVTRRGDSTDVLRDARFLQRLVQPGEEVVIMSFHSGLFHLMTRTTNPLDIPGDSELVYRTDFDKQLDYVYRRRGKTVVDKTTMNPQFVSHIRRLYRNRVENPSGNLIVLQVP